MERSVEVLATILFGVLGLSHILQPKAWAEFFILLRGKGESGAFVDGLLNLPRRDNAHRAISENRLRLISHHMRAQKGFHSQPTPWQ